MLPLGVTCEAPSPADHSEDTTAGHGEVFTRRWVVELFLDLAGYTAERDLASFVAVEPTCGAGAFLVPMIGRLAESCTRFGHDLRKVGRALEAYDLLTANVEASRQAVVQVLSVEGLPLQAAQQLAEQWVVPADFLLLSERARTADFVLGNPPYLRLENVPLSRRAAYREACATMRGRSDVFVGFIERGLRLLRDGGVLGFIADRWMRNQYGAQLRAMISDAFSPGLLERPKLWYPISKRRSIRCSKTATAIRITTCTSSRPESGISKFSAGYSYPTSPTSSWAHIASRCGAAT